MSDSLRDAYLNDGRAALRLAGSVRNADDWYGDRNADSQALALIAIANAALAIAETVVNGVIWQRSGDRI